jgi:hypothetical protein
VRVSTAFNRLLQIPGAWVTDVVIEDGDVEVSLRPRARLLRCPCGMLPAGSHRPATVHGRTTPKTPHNNVRSRTHVRMLPHATDKKSPVENTET